MAETMKLSMQFFRNLTAQNLLKFSVSKSMFYTKEKNAVVSGKSQKRHWVEKGSWRGFTFY